MNKDTFMPDYCKFKGQPDIFVNKLYQRLTITA